MDALTLLIMGIAFLLTIALFQSLRLLAEELTEEVLKLRIRNRWRKRYKHRRH